VPGPPAGLITAHRELAVAIVLTALVGAIWAGYVASRLHGGSRLRLLGTVTTAAIVVQALFGIVLAALGSRPQDGLHFVFGPLTLLALPGARWMATGQRTSSRSRGVTITIGWAVTLGLALRAVGTGGGIG
jgi:heme A synthase